MQCCQHPVDVTLQLCKIIGLVTYGTLMLGLVVSFREYIRDEFLLCSIVVYAVYEGNALLPSYVSQVFWVGFS